jgi:hypothetical protein
MRHYLITSDSPELPILAFRKALGKNRPATLEGIGGGKGGGSSPSAPDPWTVAAATTSVNRDAAAYNKALNLNNYSNPFGGQQSSISGYDASGAPIYQTNVSANPQLQAAMQGLLGQVSGSGDMIAGANNVYNDFGNQYAGLGNQFAGLGSQIDPQRAQQFAQQGQDAYYKSATSYLDPQYSQQQESLDAKLAAQGLAPGSQAYNNAMGNFQRDKDFAYSQAQNNAITQGQQMGLNQMAAQNQNINLQAGLLGQQAGLLGQRTGLTQQQVGNSQIPYSNLQSIAGLIPGYSGPATSSINPADIGAYMNNAYQGQLGQYNARQQGSNQFTSGLMGLGGTLGAAYLMSDARVKRDIRRIGEWNGTPVYSYRYVFETKRRIGVLAQEAPKHAVSNFAGVLMVDYRSL